MAAKAQTESRPVIEANFTEGSDARRGWLRQILEGAETKAQAIFRIALCASSSVTAFFFGLFAGTDLSFFSLIDKQSMIEIVVFYTATFSVLSAIVSLATFAFAKTSGADAPEPEPATWGDKLWSVAGVLRNPLRSASTHATITFNLWLDKFSALLARYVFAAVLTAIGFILWGVGFLEGAIFIGLATLVAVLLRVFGAPISVVLPCVLLTAFMMGFLRANHLYVAPQTMQMTWALSKKPVGVNVVVSSQRGLVLLMGEPRKPAFVPWDKIESLQRAPGGDSLLHDVKAEWQRSMKVLWRR